MGSTVRKARKKASLRKAINAYCRWCIYDPRGGMGAWREQVEACTGEDCPLYSVRPASTRRKPAQEAA